MRFPTSCAVLACLSLGASAEILPSAPTMILGGSAVTILPSELTSSGDGCFMIDEADGSVSVHNSSFEKKRTIAAPAFPDVVMNLEQRATLNLYLEHREWGGEMNNYPFQTIDDARAYLREKGVVWKAEVLDGQSHTGDILFVISYLSDFIEPYVQEVANLYPGFRPPVLSAEDNIPYEVYRYYAPNEKKYLEREWWPTVTTSGRTEIAGDWSPYQETREVKPVTMLYQTEQHTYDTGRIGLINNFVTWSQTLFNDDEKFECLVPDYETVPKKECGSQLILTDLIKIKYETQGDTLRVSGYSVVNDEGARLSSVAIPAGYEVAGEPQIMSLKNKSYLAVSAYAPTEESRRDAYLLMYAIDRSTSSLRSVAAPMRVAVSPTACNSGTPVNITLGDDAARPVRIAATSMNGTMAATGSIAPGASSATLDTTGLPTGMYVVTVSDSSSINDTTKLLVR